MASRLASHRQHGSVTELRALPHALANLQTGDRCAGSRTAALSSARR